MASIIKVDEILDSQGNQFDGSQLGNVGKVLQVVQAEYVNSASSTNTTFADYIAVNITPKSSTSKIYLTSIVNAYHEDSYTCFIDITRDGTRIYPNPSSSSNDNGIAIRNNDNGYSHIPVNLQAVDYPNTTSSIRYAVRLRTSSSSRAFYINRSRLFDAANSGGYTSSWLIAMEIGE